MPPRQRPRRRVPSEAARERAARPIKRRIYIGGQVRGQELGPAPITPGQAARGGGTAAAQAVTQRPSYTARHMLTAELIAGVLIVAVRAVADYEPQADGTLKGKVGHPKDQYGPLPILAGLIISFFLLSFLAASGGLKGKLAVIAGGIIDLTLLMNSTAQFEKVTATFGSFGKAKAPPGAWQTSGTAAGQPVWGPAPSSSGGGSGGQGNGGPPPGTSWRTWCEQHPDQCIAQPPIGN